jgi:hypothetical protein
MGLEDKDGKLIVPRLSNFNSFDNFANHIKNSRDACDERGYHRIAEEKKGMDEPMICYDCDLWFDKDLAITSDIQYKVEDPFKA